MHYSKEAPFCSTFRVITINFRVSEILGFLRYQVESTFTHQQEVFALFVVPLYFLQEHMFLIIYLILSTANYGWILRKVENKLRNAKRYHKVV